MWFDNAYTPIPLCCPARQALLNGRRPEAFGAHWNYDITSLIPALEPAEYSWPRELQDIGYKSGYFGKWHVNPDHDPTEYGYDDYISYRDYERFKKDKYPDVEFTNGFWGEADPVLLDDTPTHWLTGKAIKLIEKHTAESEPWHVRLDFSEPHLPCRPAKQFADMYRPENVPEWGSFCDKFENKPYIQKQQLHSWGIEDFTWEDWAPTVALYYGIISQVDDAIGRILDTLDRLGVTNNTLVIYTADHGDMCGGHRMIDKHYIMYDDVVKVPMAIRWPGIVKEGSICSEFVYNCLDLPPTMLEVHGIEPKDFFYGRSLMPLLRGESMDDWRNEVVSTYNGQQFGLYTQRMLRNNRWKYIWNLTDVDELYDMENDPDELNNLIYDEKSKGLLSTLRKQLYDILMKEDRRLVDNLWIRKQLLDNKKI
jgi:arylsulfatase A-like enzyme